MNLKRWFAWACLALMLVSELFLFAANRQKEIALAAMRDAQAQLYQAQKELTELKNSNVGLQAAEILRLRKQNEILTKRQKELETTLAELTTENTSNAQHLATARFALQLQQQHIQELEAANQQVQLAAATNVAAAAASDAVIIAQKTCLLNLRHIDDAKQEWSAENDAPDNALPTVADLLPYLQGGIFPACPSGGTYSINAVDEVPTCSYPTHVLPGN
jgi:hypothetical protein